MQAEETFRRPADRSPKFLPSPKQLFVILALYFTAQVILRTFVSDTVDMDEADQLVLTQKLSWGYGPQPPLYSWIQVGFFHLFGVGIFALALWKFILLFSTHCLVYANVRFLTRSHICAVAGVASLFLFPQISWESVRDLTHSVLATTLSVVTLLALMRLQEKPKLTGYLLLGACFGLGFLGKYNFVLVIGGLIAAGLTVPQYRRVILDFRFALTLLAALVIVLPNTLWMLNHPDLVTVTAYKFRIQEHAGWLQTILHGLANFGIAVLTFLGAFAVVFAILLVLQPRKKIQWHSDHEKLISRNLLLTILGFLAAIFILHTTGFRDRWFQPIFISIPILAVSLFRDRIDLRFARRLVLIAGVVMVSTLTAIYARVVFSEKFDFLTHLNNPYSDFARQLRPSLDGINTVVCDEKLLAGNLRLSIPGKIFTSPELIPVLADDTNRFGIAWEAIKSEHPPANITNFIERFGLPDVNALQPQLVESRYKFYHKKTMRIGFVIFNPQALEQKSQNKSQF